MTKKLTKRKLFTWIISIFLVVVIFVKISLYSQDYYRASASAMDYINNPAPGVTVEDKRDTIVFTPENVEAGFIFYPGGMVEPEAYAPLMEQLAENGVECIVIKMPHYLAFFDANGARGIQQKYPEIDKWYIGGHSLGGAMASMYGNLHAKEYEGVIFLAAYATNDMTDKDIKALLIRGDQDGVLNMDRYNESFANLPKETKEVVIKGGCHAYFGDYGPQFNDGTPNITVEEQTQQTLAEIVDFIKE
ncbi:alpha/beta hydrolase [Pseudobutyrivibrio xylanivorans]|uniref:Alpha/beta hydrolase n=1 Tax=Pseudobutyrivibrio xylanivorans TaxID=185007 RepID=A0A5P6VRL8_PSEXY|nr:alpha/beta hydrolase [Pseudobutyrivibrio xylanivorans]